MTTDKGTKGAQAMDGRGTPETDHEAPSITVLGTVEELTQLGTGPGREDLAQGSAA